MPGPKPGALPLGQPPVSIREPCNFNPNWPFLQPKFAICEKGIVVSIMDVVQCIGHGKTNTTKR